MKFCKNLQRVAELSNPEWNPFWTDYKQLKKLIKRIGEFSDVDDEEEREEIHGTKISPSSLSTKTGTCGSPWRKRIQPDEAYRRIELVSTINTSSSGESGGASSFTHNQNDGTSGNINNDDSPENNSHHDRVRRERKQRNIESIRNDPGEIEFFKLLHYEFQKAVHFFERAIDEFTIREERVRQGIGIIKSNGRKKGLWNPLAKSVYRLYTDLLLLETFCIMTYCSFFKIFKKHDKCIGYEIRNAFMMNVVNNANFTNYTSLREMIDRCKVFYDEVSDQIAREGQQGLYEDERLFIDMIHQLNRPETQAR